MVASNRPTPGPQNGKQPRSESFSIVRAADRPAAKPPFWVVARRFFSTNPRTLVQVPGLSSVQLIEASKEKTMTVTRNNLFEQPFTGVNPVEQGNGPPAG